VIDCNNARSKPEINVDDNLSKTNY